MSTNELLEPELLYKNELKEKHHDNVVKYFDDLVKKSGVSESENRATCKKYYEALAELEVLRKKENNLSMLLVLFVILSFIIVGIFLIFAVYRPKKQALKLEIRNKEDDVELLLNEAKIQMAPLNRLFDTSIPSKIMETTTPLIDMDRIFDVKKYELLHDKYGLWDNVEEDSSVLDLQSGNILGNPFVVFKELHQEMVNERYVGTKLITYTVGSGENKRIVTQTLEAVVEKPKPVYSKETYLVYGNEAAMHLKFSRDPSKINSMDEKEIQRYVKHHERDLVKYAEKSAKNGGNYTPLGNAEFELFFGGLDRNNEVEYRLLFTPLAQKSMLQVLKSKIGYGDDFRFVKDGGLNLITSVHSQNDVLFIGPDEFKGIDLDKMRTHFYEFNDNYFKALFFDFAPLLSIPLYQQQKAHEYIYKDNVGSNFNCFEHEVLANKFNLNAFKPLKAVTDIILKTKLVKKEKESDIVKVCAHSFATQKHLDLIPKMGGDGRMHEVPVEWIEYIPVSQESEITVSDLEIDDEVKFKKLGQSSVIYAKGLVSTMSDLNVDIKQIKSYMKKD